MYVYTHIHTQSYYCRKTYYILNILHGKTDITKEKSS